MSVSKQHAALIYLHTKISERLGFNLSKVQMIRTELHESNWEYGDTASSKPHLDRCDSESTPEIVG